MGRNDKTKSIGTTIKRLPGQTLREEREKLIDSLINEPAMLMFVGWAMFGIECLHVFTKTPPSIWIGIPIAIATTVYALRKAFKARSQLRKYRRGEEGERIVAQAIEQSLFPKTYYDFD